MGVPNNDFPASVDQPVVQDANLKSPPSKSLIAYFSQAIRDLQQYVLDLALGGGFTAGEDLASIDATHQKVIGINTMPLDTTVTAPSAKGVWVGNAGSSALQYRQLSTDDLGAAFSPSLALATGGSGPFLLGATWTPTFAATPAPNAGGISSPLISDNQGHANVAIVGGNNISPPTVSSYTLTAPGTVSVFVTETEGGVTKNTNSVSETWGSDVWSGVGTAGATGLNGTTGALAGATGTLAATLSTTGIVAFSPSPTSQKVYYASDTFYGTRTFKDANGFTFAMNAPTSISVTNANGVARTTYLYESQNLLSSVATPITPA